jgi:hypothetical protein
VGHTLRALLAKEAEAMGRTPALPKHGWDLTKATGATMRLSFHVKDLSKLS